MADFTISSSGFINYIPSAERTKRQIENAYKQFGEDIAIIDGDDDWYADEIFKVSLLLQKAGIEKLGDFHIGISGISKSGAVIKAEDLQKFLAYVKIHAPRFIIEPGQGIRYRLAVYDKVADGWDVLVAKAWH